MDLSLYSVVYIKLYTIKLMNSDENPGRKWSTVWDRYKALLLKVCKNSFLV